jgi:hypothetical protein
VLDYIAENGMPNAIDTMYQNAVVHGGLRCMYCQPHVIHTQLEDSNIQGNYQCVDVGDKTLLDNTVSVLLNAGVVVTRYSRGIQPDDGVVVWCTREEESYISADCTLRVGDITLCMSSSVKTELISPIINSRGVYNVDRHIL